MEKTNLVIPANSSPNSDNPELISIIPWDNSDSSQGQITIYHDLTKSVPTFLVGSSERIVEEERNKTIVIEAVKIGVSEGKKSYANLDITQEAATYDYVLELYSDLEDNTIPSTGGSCNITAALVTYRNGRKVSTKKVSPQLSGSSTGFKLVGNVVTAENRNMVIGPDRYIMISGYTDDTETGKTVVGTIMIKQQRNIIERVDFNDTLLYDKDIPASGGSINPIITVDRTYTYTTGNTINNSIPDSEYIESKSETIEFTTTREPIDPFTLDENTGTVSAPSRGTVKGPRLELPVSMNYSLDIKYTFDENHISFEDSVSDSAYQAENGLVYSDIEAYGSAEEVPASGGTVSEALKVIYKQIASFSSGEIEEITSGAEITYEPVEIPSKGTEISNLDKRGVLPTTISLNGKSVTIDIDIYQRGNYVTGLTILDGSMSYPTIGAGATSATPSIVSPYVKFTFSSGSVTSNKPDPAYGSYNASVKYSLGSVQNGFTAVNENSGILTATNRGTEIGNARTSGVVTRRTIGTWTPTSDYNSAGTITTEYNLTATCTQAENKVESYGTPTGRTLSVSDIPASGGTVSSGTLGGTITQTRTFSSGASNTITNPTVTSSSYSAGVSNGSLGTTVVPRTKIGTLTYSYVCNGKTGSVSADVYQQANTRYDKRTVLHFDNFVGPASKTVSAVGGQVNLSLELVRGFTSGAEGNSVDVTNDKLSSYSVSGTGFSISSSDKGLVLVANRGTTVGSERNGTVTGTWNGLTSPAIVCTQEANIIESEIIEVDSFVYSKTIPYTGGTSTPSISVDSIKTYSSEATSRSDVTNYTKKFSSSNLPEGFSLDGSTGVVTGANYTGSTERSASIKVDVSYTNTLGGVVTASKTATVVQEEADIVYSDPVITFTYLEAPASGGTLTPTISVTQTWGYGQTTGGGSNTYNINTLPAGSYKITGTGVTPTNKGVVTVSNLGKTLKSRTKLGSVLISVTLNGKTSSKNADVYQAANNVERVAITTGGGVDDPYPTKFSAAGDAYVAAAWAYYTSNAKQEIQDATFDNWAISGSGFLMTADPNYKYAVDIGAENRGTTVGPERSATISFEYSGKSDSITLTQEANEQKQTACSIEIDHDYQDPLGYNNTNVPAAGGRVCIVGVRHYSYTSGATSQIEYDSFTLNCNQSWCVSDDASNLTISSRGTVTGSDRSATVYWQDGSCKSNEMTITQKANQEASYSIYGGVESKTPTGGANDWMSAGGGTFTFFTQLKVTYSSGSTEERSVTQNTEYVMDSGGYATVTGNKATIPGRGITIGNARYCGFTQRYSIGGKTYTSWFNTAQNGNYVESIKGSVGTFSYPTIGAGATSATPDLSAGFGVLFTFSSGSTSSSTPASTYGSLSVTSSFKLYALQNGFTAVNSSTGVLTATNRGTTVGAARTSGTVTRTLTATWTPTSSYNEAGTKTNSWSTTATCTQEANSVTIQDAQINTFAYPEITYQAATYQPTTDISYTSKYTSGTVVTDHGLPDGYETYYWITWASSIINFVTINSSTGEITVQANNEVTTRSFYVHVQLNGPSGNISSADITLTQQAKPRPNITLTLGYTSAGWVSVMASQAVVDSLTIIVQLWDPVSGAGQDVILDIDIGGTYAEQLVTAGYQASIQSVNGDDSSPYSAANADYTWTNNPITLKL